MAAPRRHIVLGVWLFALLLRVVYLWEISDEPFLGLRLGDAEAYHTWARTTADGDWAGSGVFYQAPLYPYMLAVVYRALGDSVLVVRIVQAILGASACALVARAGMSLFGAGGALAGVLLAVYPTAIYFDGLLEKTSLVIFFTAALLAVLAPSPERPSARNATRPPRNDTGQVSSLSAWRSLGAGAVLGVLVLTRENALFLVPVVLLWVWIGAGERARSRAGAAAAFIVGLLLILLPVSLRNLAVGGEFHLTTSQFGPNFYIGNHQGASGVYEALVPGHGSAADEREDAIHLAERATGRAMRPSEVSAFWTRRALEYVSAQPVDWLRLSARKLALTVNAAEIADTESREVYAERSVLLRVLSPFGFGTVLAMAAASLVLTAGQWRRLWVLYAIVVAYVLSVALFFVLERYRIPIVPVLMLLAAGGIVHAVSEWRDRRDVASAAVPRSSSSIDASSRGRSRRQAASAGRSSNEVDASGRPDRRRMAAAAAAAALAMACAHLPLAAEDTARSVHYGAIASVLSNDPRQLDEAIRFYRRALEETPDWPVAHLGLGTALFKAGRASEAVEHFRRAAALRPDYAEAHYNLGLGLAATGRVQEAVAEYRAALTLRPDELDTQLALGKAYLTLDQPERAAQQYQQTLAAHPRTVAALLGLGVALTHMGRSDAAVSVYERALAIDPNEPDLHNNLGFTLATSGRVAEAVPHFERALAIDPADENAKKNLARAREILKAGR